MRFFNKITLETPESVELEFTLAGIGNRTLALIIDYLLWSVLLLTLTYTWLLFSEQIFQLLEKWAGIDKLELWVYAIFYVLIFAVYVGYFVFFETLWQGQTPGKRLTKIRVIRDNGKTAGLIQATLRSLLRPIDDLLFLGFFFILLTRREKRIGDILAGTIVIQEESSKKLTLTISEPAKKFAPKLNQMANISALMPDDFAIISEYLQRRPKMKSTAKTQVTQQLAAQLQDILSLETIPTQITTEQFIEAVYFAYQKQSSNNR